MHELMKILKSYHLNKENEDSWRWIHAANGIFKSKDALDIISTTDCKETNAKKKIAFRNLLSSHALRSVQTIAWKVLWQILPTKVSLQKEEVQSNQTKTLTMYFVEKMWKIQDIFLPGANSLIKFEAMFILGSSS